MKNMEKREVFRPEADAQKIRKSCASFDPEQGGCTTMTETVCAYRTCSFFIAKEKAQENALKSIVRRKKIGFPLKKHEEKMLKEAGITVEETDE